MLKDQKLLARLDSEKSKAKLRQLVADSKHLGALGQNSEAWLVKIITDADEFDEVVDFTVAFLLSLLPNLESLTLSRHWKGMSSIGESRHIPGHLTDLERWVPELVHLLVTRGNTPGFVDQPLQKLRLLNSTADVDGRGGGDLESIFPFLALDSLVEARHDPGVCEPNQEMDAVSQKLYPTLGKNLCSLTLGDSVLSHGECARVFEHMTNLKTLRLEYQAKDWGIGLEWNINRFVFNLIQAVGGNLEELHLNVGTIYFPRELLQFRPALTDSKSFAVWS